MARPTFKEAGDVLCLSGRELAGLFNVPAQSLKQARLDPSSRGYRPPPDGWEGKFARLARKLAKELVALAKELEG